MEESLDCQQDRYWVYIQPAQDIHVHLWYLKVTIMPQRGLILERSPRELQI